MLAARVLRKVLDEQATCVLVLPAWYKVWHALLSLLPVHKSAYSAHDALLENTTGSGSADIKYLSTSSAPTAAVNALCTRAKRWSK
jgi:hypothetical protein